jgi:hypothetical protein
MSSEKEEWKNRRKNRWAFACWLVHSAEIFFALRLRGKQVVIARKIPTHCRGPKGDHFQPQYRMSFALKSGHQRWTCFLISHLFLPGDSLVNLFIRCKLRQRRDLRIQKGNEGSNRTRSAMQSDLQRFSLDLPRNTRIMPVFRDHSQANRTSRERTARHRIRYCPGFSPEGIWAVRFQGGHKANAMRSQAGDSAIAS